VAAVCVSTPAIGGCCRGPLAEANPPWRTCSSGWQLSLGERGRLNIAHTLLPSADVAVLDESFAALDPEVLQRALQYVCNGDTRPCW
jgi:ABC-type uncharacterized transport system fused permease/ATPase subunit